MKITSIQKYITSIKAVADKWDPRTTPWFRGEPGEVDTPLLPSLYRLVNGKRLNENEIVQSFRRMARGFCNYPLPNRDDTEEWLFLMQHQRLPTRLLDWTEGALIGLYFAIEYKAPVVWMLNPDRLNQRTYPEAEIGSNIISWIRPNNGKINILHENLRGAWELDKRGVDLPIAIKPAYIHPRMAAQKSCFTVHGLQKRSVNVLVPKSVLAKFEIDENAIPEIQSDLRMLGITHTSVFPELEYFAKEIRDNAVSRAQ